MQLRVPPPPEPHATGGRAERRRRARLPVHSRATEAAAEALTRLRATLGPRLAPLAPYARRLKPLYPRPGRTGWRRWMPSWRQWLGSVLSGFVLLGLFLVVAYEM